MLLLLLFFVGGNAQFECSRLQHGERQHHAVFFHDFIGKGGAEGAIAIGGNSRLDQFTAGSKLSNDAEYSLLVGGDLDFECGDTRNNVFHGGNLKIGPRVDWFGYTSGQVGIGSLYEFASAQAYYAELSNNLFQIKPGSSNSQRQGDTFILTGSQLTTEIFHTSCESISGAKRLLFNSINDLDTTSIIINVEGKDDECSIDFDILQISGLGWIEPTGHILWNFEATTLNFNDNGVIMGGILAPNTKITGRGHILGQVIVDSGDGTFYMGANMYRGCIPTDTCFVLREECGDPVMPPFCISPTKVTDPDNECCEIYNCLPNCDDVMCPGMALGSDGHVVDGNNFCEGNYVLTKVADSIEKGGYRTDSDESADPCCDTYDCLPRPMDANGPHYLPHPIVYGCPLDIERYLVRGTNTISVEWTEPTFLYVSSVAGNYDNPDFFPVGTHFISYVAMGLVPNTSASCYFAIKIRETKSSTCTVGGVDYEEGDWLLNDCAQKCLCAGGQLTQCRRVRKELQSMTENERAYYFQVFKTVYNHPDEKVRVMVNDHVGFFSRGLHNNGAFLPWHRGYILELENRLQVADCKVTVPYWDWSANPQIRTSVIFGEAAHQASDNGGRDRCVNTGTFGFRNGFALTNGRCLQRRISGSNAATYERVASQIHNRYTEASDFDQMRNRLEHGPGLHDSIHCLVGGTMCSARSSNDPVFFSHHANIDQIWDTWQSRGGEAFIQAYSGNTQRDRLMPVSPWTPAQMLDNMNLPGGVAVSYFSEEKYTDAILNTFTDEDFNGVGFPHMQEVGDQFLIEMNMDPLDIETIHRAEDIMNLGAVQQAVALTLRNGVERGYQMPGFLDVVKTVSERIAAASEGEQGVSPLTLFQALQHTMVQNGVIPRIHDLLDIILVEGDTIVDVMTILEPINCAPVNTPVCAEGRTFPNECEATQAGANTFHDGPCLPPDLPLPLDPTIDGGASDAYNHAEQEVQTCPESLPAEGSECPVTGVTCYYGQMCCDLYETTITCTDFTWSFVHYVCPQNCDIPTPVVTNSQQVTIPAMPFTRSPTRAPTRAPTRSPTRAPTRSPTRSPTRPNTISRPTPPRPVIRPPPPRPVTRPQPRQVFIPSTPSDRRSVVVPVTSSLPPRSTGRIIPPAVCPEIDCPTQEPICCNEGSELGRPPIMDSRGRECGRGCLTCMSGVRTTQVPACCIAPVPCPQVTCSPGTQLRLVRPKGSNNQVPCCDEFECVSDDPCADRVCPTLEGTTCNFDFEVPRYTQELDDTECCQMINCVFHRCQDDTRECSSGGVTTVVVRDPASQPTRCMFPSCPIVCDTSQQFCTTTGGVLVPRDRSSATAVIPCMWLDCPPYEPCEDVSLIMPDTNNRCGNGDCLPGFSTIQCDCHNNWEGPRCRIFTEPERVRVGFSERTFMLTTNCLGYMCHHSRCYVTTDSGNEWNPLPARLVAILGYYGDNLWFADSDEHPALFIYDAPESEAVISDSTTDLQWNSESASQAGFVPASVDFSVRTAEDGVFPPASESRYILNYERALVDSDEACSVHVYLTQSHLVFYNAFHMYKTAWDSACVDENGNRQDPCLHVSEFNEMCENKCVDENGLENNCNDNGICVRETGECLCNYGFGGSNCETYTRLLD